MAAVGVGNCYDQSELIAHLKANPDKLAYGAAGCLNHLAPLLFLQANGVSALHVP
jgi:tripartite-type tricarboxylate transporter receptor subunit TctC